MESSEKIRVIELFAGVGGFRLGLEGHPDKKWKMRGAGGFETVWANQWEPPGTKSRQFAFECYRERFQVEGTIADSVVNDDLAVVLDRAEAGDYEIPGCDMIVGGFPCQDYSVAKTLSKAGGIEGKKGVLWWEILRLVDLKKPRYLLLENVDRLLKSPAYQRGRDFAIMLSCLNDRGFSVEWRVVNAADYGFPQKRKRVFIYAEHTAETWDLRLRLVDEGVLAEALPIRGLCEREGQVVIPNDVRSVSASFGVGDKISRFQDAGVMQGGRVHTARVTPCYRGKKRVLGDVLVPEDQVPAGFYVSDAALSQWRILKDKKAIERVSMAGHKYRYSEGSMAFPDQHTNPARTILTGEGGATPSRFKHIIRTDDGRFRRLVPDELDQLQGFPKGWTDTGMSDRERAFCMGNALVVGLPKRIGKVIRSRHAEALSNA
ncbi:MAG: DNA (cytosine-5-)-methyltransferase [Coriobacteriia bacterium]|nr:DNA (cytosine-5-)-methyltransferase [Coriobacteriia bacterium]